MITVIAHLRQFLWEILVILSINETIAPSLFLEVLTKEVQLSPMYDLVCKVYLFLERTSTLDHWLLEKEWPVALPLALISSAPQCGV